MRRTSILILTALVCACSDEPAGVRGTTAPEAATATTTASSSSTVFGLEANNSIIVFRSSSPGQLLRRYTVSGLAANETLVGIDFRPANGKLYGISSLDRVFVLPLERGSATVVGTSVNASLAGESFGVDFNPMADRIRVHGESGQNLRLHPDLGSVAATDTVLAFEAADANAGNAPRIVATAYTNSAFNGGTAPATTILFALDTRADVLVRLASPNNGRLTTVGPLGIPATALGGFDIVGVDNNAFAAIRTAASGVGFYRIDLTTGAASLVGAVPSANLLGITAR